MAWNNQVDKNIKIPNDSSCHRLNYQYLTQFEIPHWQVISGWKSIDVPVTDKYHRIEWFFIIHWDKPIHNHKSLYLISKEFQIWSLMMHMGVIFLVNTSQNMRPCSVLVLSTKEHLKRIRLVNDKVVPYFSCLKDYTFQLLALALVLPTAVARFVIFHFSWTNFTHQVIEHLG